MKVLAVAFVVGVLSVCCMAEVGVPCTDSSQCAGDECCQIVNIIVASRRRQLTNPNTSGTCEKYSHEGVTCNSFDTMNGFCGCAAGLTCKTVHVSTTTTPSPIHILQPRRPAPGYISFCAPAH